MQITLYDENEELRALLLGDLSYPIIKRIFKVSEADDLAWNRSARTAPLLQGCYVLEGQRGRRGGA